MWRAWISFIGPPDVLHFDPLRSHIGSAVRDVARQYDILARPILAEAHNQQGKIERRVDFFENLFVRVCEETYDRMRKQDLEVGHWWGVYKDIAPLVVATTTFTAALTCKGSWASVATPARDAAPSLAQGVLGQQAQAE